MQLKEMRGLFCLVIILISAAAASAAPRPPPPPPAVECGKKLNKTCPHELCCSKSGHCNLTEDSCSVKNGCQSYCWTGEGYASNVTAFYAFYNATQNKWNMTLAKVECAKVDGRKPEQWRKKFGWTGFCGPKGPKGEEACGKCVRVENRKKNAGKTVFETVRVVDTCGSGAFDLDYEVFTRLDFDGSGYDAGHLYVDYQFVQCEDKEDELDYNGGKNILLASI